MFTVYKYQAEISDTFILRLPKGAKILSAQMQRDVPQVWALVDTEQPEEERAFRFCGTGHEIEKEIVRRLKHVGTFQQNIFVWHLFEILPLERVLANAVANNFMGINI